MLTVVWPSHQSQNAQVWRVLDLSGLTKSVRESRNFTRAGFVYVDGSKKTSLNDTVPIGKTVNFKLIFPNGKEKSQDIMLVHRTPRVTQRESRAFKKHYRG